MKKLFFPLIAIIMAVAAYAGQDMLKIHLKDGSTQTIAVSAIDSLTFEQMQSAGTFSVVDLTTKSVELKFVPAKTLGTFNIGVIKASDLNAFANDEAFCADQAKKFDADAKSWGMSLSEYLDFSLYKGNEIDDTKTFPYSDLEEGTEYVAYAYGVNTADGTANTTVEKFTFTTESLLELDFKLSTSDLTAKSGIINTNPTDANATYYIGYVTADAYTKDFGGDDQTLLNNAVGTINTNLAMGGTFDAVAKKGAMRSLMSGLTPNTAYYAIAFGIKKHKANTVYNTTPLQKLAFTTPGFEVTDNCTFGIATENIQAMLFDVKVTPSNADTRYYVAIKADSETAGKTAEQIADEQIVFEDGFSINWATSKQIHTGTQTLNSRTDIGATNLKPETDYTIYVFGMDTKGYRTTAVSTAKVRTSEVKKSDMTISFEGVTAGDEADSQDFFKRNYYVNFTPVPTKNDEYYFVGLVSATDYEFETAFGSDEEFMSSVISAAGENIMLNCFLGKPSAPLKGQLDYKGNALKPGTKYYIIAFGYQGKATTPLFKQEVTTTGEAETGGGNGGWGF